MLCYSKELTHHTSHDSVSVVRTTFKVYGKRQSLTLSQPKTPEPIVTKFEWRDYVVDAYHQKNLGSIHPGVFAHHIGEIYTPHVRNLLHFFGSWTRLQASSLDRFLRLIHQVMRTCARKCHFIVTLPYLRGLKALAPAQRWGHISSAQCASLNVTTRLQVAAGYKAVDGCEAVNRQLWSHSQLWSWNQHKSTGNV